MNLRDYIGDTRTDSLPAGFLKSIKIKYRHEESHVFPRRNSRQNVVETVAESIKTTEENGKEKKENGEASNKLAPSFISYRVPSRLLAKKGALPSAHCKKSITGRVDTSKVISISRQSTAPFLGSTHNSKFNIKNDLPIKAERKLKTAAIRPKKICKAELVFLPKEFIQGKGVELKNKFNVDNSVGTGRVSTSKLPKHSNGIGADDKMLTERKLSPKGSNINTRIKDMNKPDENDPKEVLPHVQHIPPSPKFNETSKDEEKYKLLPELTGENGSVLIGNKITSPERMDKINAWMDNSTKKERRVAFDLLSSFIQNDKIQSSKPKRDRIMIALEALESRKRTPASLQPLSDLPKKMTIVSLDTMENENKTHFHPGKGQHLKTWHRLPVYSHTNVYNKGATFIQPAKVYDRHFTIHPEWGIHKSVPIVKS